MIDPIPRKEPELPPRMPEAATIARLTKDIEHWRHEVGKRQSQVARLTAQLTAANQLAAASVEAVARANAERDALEAAIAAAQHRLNDRYLGELKRSDADLMSDYKSHVASAWGQAATIVSQSTHHATAALNRVKDDVWNAAIDAAADEVHKECWTGGTDGIVTETLMAEQSTTALAIRAILALRKQENSHD